jgi:hypothetical protein
MSKWITKVGYNGLIDLILGKSSWQGFSTKGEQFHIEAKQA